MRECQKVPSFARTTMALRDLRRDACIDPVVRKAGPGSAMSERGRDAWSYRALAFAGAWLLATHLLGYLVARTVAGHPDELPAALLALAFVAALAMLPSRLPAPRRAAGRDSRSQPGRARS